MNPKRFTFALAGILVVLLGAIGYGYWYGKQTLNGGSAKLATALADRNQAEQTISQLIKLKRQYTLEVEPVMPKIDAFLPKSKEQSQALLQLQALAGNHSVTISTINMPNPTTVPSATSQAVPQSGLYELPITMVATGSYANLQAFLKQVEVLSRFINVSSLSIGNANGKLSYNLQLNAYFEP